MHVDFYFSESRYIFDNSAIAHHIFEFIQHENYYDEGFSNDIAILMILDAFEFGIYVNKGILTDSLDWMNESVNVIAAGWGETKVRINHKTKRYLSKKTRNRIFLTLNFIITINVYFCLPKSTRTL